MKIQAKALSLCKKLKIVDEIESGNDGINEITKKNFAKFVQNFLKIFFIVKFRTRILYKIPRNN